MAIGFTALLTLHWCSKAGRAALLHREIKADGSRRWSCAGPWSLSGVAAAVPGTAHPRARPGLWGCWSPGLCWSRLMALIPCASWSPPRALPEPSIPPGVFQVWAGALECLRHIPTALLHWTAFAARRPKLEPLTLRKCFHFVLEGFPSIYWSVLPNSTEIMCLI